MASVDNVNRTRRLVAALVAVGAVAAACGRPAAPAGGTSPSYDGTWQLADGSGPGGPVPIVHGHRITLDIAGEAIGGTAACNGYGGDARIAGDTFTVAGGVAVTDMACADPVMESEAAYLEALSGAIAIARERDTLSLSGPRIELRFRLVPAPPTAELVETDWQLESLLTGAGGTVTSAAPARLFLAAGGGVSGSTGCRRFDGRWIERGDEILFTELAAEGDCEPRLRDQDAHVLSVLGDGFRATIDGRTLRVVSDGENGLTYSAP